MEIHSEIHSSEQSGCDQIDEFVNVCQEIVRSAPKVVDKLSLEQLTQLGSRIDVGKVQRLAISINRSPPVLDGDYLACWIVYILAL